MPSAVEFVPLSVYLKSVYEPDAEYVDGEIEGRPMGENDNDYHAMGIPEIWVVDPETQIFFRFEEGQLMRKKDFALASKNISFPLIQIEAMLD